MSLIAFTGPDIFDGEVLHPDKALLVEDGLVRGILAGSELPSDCVIQQIEGGTILPGFVDLQVNGGGGVMFNDDQSVETLSAIARAHARVGTRALLPTLITDMPRRTMAAIDAVEAAIDQGVPGIIGIHLEGPHLSVARKGAHDPALIRPMTDSDMAMLCDAATRLPNVMTTVAPENATPEQIAALTQAGIVVSLGHTDASYDIAMSAFDSGASCVTHLFNAMSPLESREPGLVGAALDDGRVSAGLIADDIHVHAASIRAALAAKRGPGRIFLVTDAMATIGSDITEFTLNGRRVLRRDGRLTLVDGTLAGADLDMPTAIEVMATKVGIGLEQALAMATSIPASCLRSHAGVGRFEEGQPAMAIHLRSNRSVTGLN